MLLMSGTRRLAAHYPWNISSVTSLWLRTRNAEILCDIHLHILCSIDQSTHPNIQLNRMHNISLSHNLSMLRAGRRNYSRHRKICMYKTLWEPTQVLHRQVHLPGLESVAESLSLLRSVLDEGTGQGLDSTPAINGSMNTWKLTTDFHRLSKFLWSML